MKGNDMANTQVVFIIDLALLTRTLTAS